MQDKPLTRMLCGYLASHLKGEPASMPYGVGPLFFAFLDLSRARTTSERGPNPISYTEIEAYARLMRMPLQPQHVTAITKMDRLWMEHVYAKPEAPPLTTAAFDAMTMDSGG